jgi:uncharacterized membrane protein YfcA
MAADLRNLGLVIEVSVFPLLFATGLAAGFVDSIAGGGGLITVPVLLQLGLDPRLALATNKLQSTCGSASATWHHARAGTLRARECLRGFCLSFAGAVAGALMVQVIHRALLGKMIPLLLVSIVVFMMLRPKLGDEDLHPRLPRGVFDLGFGLVLGFYDGFFGPGVGMFWAIAFVFGLGFNLTKATASTKAMNFASNLGSLLLFAGAGLVLWLPGLVMGAGQLLGAWAGSRMVVSRGARFIRPVFLAVATVITAKLLLEAWL